MDNYFLFLEIPILLYILQEDLKMFVMDKVMILHGVIHNILQQK